MKPLATLIALSFLLTACSGGGGGGDSSNPPIFTPPTLPPTQPIGSNESLFQCPTSTTTFARGTSAATQNRGVPSRSHPRTVDPNALVVTFASATAAQVEPAIASRLSGVGATKVGALEFSAIGKSARMIHVSAANQAALRASLATTPGVQSVSELHRLFTKTVSNPYVTNDPFFSSSASASVAGQWDMHQVGMEYAFGYSQANNGSGITNPNALGSTGVRLAVIDTGIDVRHPDLSGNSIVRSACYITDANGVLSTGVDVTDPQGHGTNVTGIAAAGVNNGFGFIGTAGNISLMLYRVFPTADDSCTSATATNPQCGAADIDIASAINDAVSHGANVINLSVGGDACTSGQDPSAVEGNAIANAIASNVIVVAASGNEGASTADAPGCDPGVIAVGATGYNDGVANGTGYNGANREYVANYSNGGATLVAPGGDPASNSDNDNLHWIENAWTSTPFDSNYAGFCNTDPFNESGDCRDEIAGTSMSTPHVAGAAALVLSVNSSYGTPARMKQLLCQTADNINDSFQGCGRLNVYRAVATAVGDPRLP